MPKSYSQKFKASALELLEQGMTQPLVCADLGGLEVRASGLGERISPAPLRL